LLLRDFHASVAARNVAAIRTN